MNCSKYFSNEIKRRYGYYNLNIKYSKMYIDFHSSVLQSSSSSSTRSEYDIMQAIEARVSCPSEQICLNFRHASWQIEKEDISKIKDSMNVYINDNSFLVIHALDLSFDISSPSISLFAGIYYVSITDCKSLTDVSPLKGSKIINLHNCTSVEDVSMLGSALELNISYTRVKDVSALGQVRKLIMNSCKRIKDFTPLRDVDALFLQYNDQLRDISFIRNVHCLYLQHCINITDVSPLAGVYLLDLEGCTGVRDVSMLGCVHRLFLNGCELVEDISSLGDVFELSIINVPNITRFLPEANHKVEKLRMSSIYLRQLRSFRKNYKELEIWGDFSNDDLSLLEGCSNLIIAGNQILTSVNNLSSLQFLTIHPFVGSELKEIFNLPCLKYLYLTSINNINIDIDFHSIPNLVTLQLECSLKFSFLNIRPPMKHVVLKCCVLSEVHIYCNLEEFRLEDIQVVSTEDGGDQEISIYIHNHSIVSRLHIDEDIPYNLILMEKQ